MHRSDQVGRSFYFRHAKEQTGLDSIESLIDTSSNVTYKSCILAVLLSDMLKHEGGVVVADRMQDNYLSADLLSRSRLVCRNAD